MDYQTIIDAIRVRIGDFTPKVGLVLGSGLGDFDRSVDVTHAIDYGELPGFPVSTAPGHAGRFLFGYLENLPVVVMQGRFHLYEGYTPQEVVAPIRVMGGLGIKALLLTNAAGGVNAAFKVGDLMVIDDHISCFVPSPLIGPNEKALGDRFPDMTEVYDPEFITQLYCAADELGVSLVNGVYCQLTGPNFETPAEVNMVRLLGGDAVGMSTAIEAMAARHQGIRVAGISLISNAAAGLNDEPLDEQEVIDVGKKRADDFANLVRAFLAKIKGGLS